MPLPDTGVAGSALPVANSPDAFDALGVQGGVTKKLSSTLLATQAELDAHAHTGTYGRIPLATDRIIYVSNGASAADANDGLTPYSAKATIAGAYAALPAGKKGTIEVMYGSFPCALSVVTGTLHMLGAGESLTTLTFTGSTGFALDLETSGPHYVSDLTIDGTGSTVSAGALRLKAGMSRNKFVRVNFNNFTGATAAAVVLDGSLDNTFDNCRWATNTKHLRLAGSGIYPSNQNTFEQPQFIESTTTTGAAVEIVDGDGNVFNEMLAQGNRSLYTVSITNSPTGLSTCRANTFDKAWLEENGGTQAGSRNFHVVGSSSANPINAFRVTSSQLLASTQNNPTDDIYLENVSDPFIRWNYGQLGAPHRAVVVGPNVLNPNIDENSFAGEVQATARPVVSARRTTGQTVGIGATAKVVFEVEDIDTNGYFATSTFTPKLKGDYRVVVNMALENCDDAMPWDCHVYKNGVVHTTAKRVTSGTGQQTLDVEAVVSVNGTTDTIEAWVTNNGATARNLGVGTRILIGRA